MAAYNSEQNLGPNEIVKRKIDDSTTDSNDPYVPFNHRDHQNSTPTFGSFIHLLKSSLGSGILAMPSAYKNAGLAFGFGGTIVVGFICTYCVHMLVKVSHEICAYAKVPSLGFSETSGAAFQYGPPKLRKFSNAAKLFVDGALLLTYFMGNSVYVVLVAESIQQLSKYWGWDADIKIFILVVTAGLLMTAQVRELKHLVPFSFCANLFILVGFIITLYYIFRETPDFSEVKMVFDDVTTLPQFFVTVIFAMEGIGVVMPVENNMKNPQHFLGCPGVLNCAMAFVVFLYSTIGFFGYMRYGDETNANLTMNLPVDEIAAQIVKLLIAISVFLTYNLQLYVPMDIIWRKSIKKYADTKQKRHLFQIIMRCTFVVGTMGIALAVPRLEQIIGLVGAICFSTLGLLIPSVIETVWKWEGKLGVFKWRLIKNVLLGMFSLFALISGSAQSINALLKPVETPI